MRGDPLRRKTSTACKAETRGSYRGTGELTSVRKARRSQGCSGHRGEQWTEIVAAHSIDTEIDEVPGLGRGVHRPRDDASLGVVDPTHEIPIDEPPVRPHVA